MKEIAKKIFVLLIVLGLNIDSVNAATTWYLTNNSHPTISALSMEAGFSGSTSKYILRRPSAGETLFTNSSSLNGWATSGVFPSGTIMPAGNWTFTITCRTNSSSGWYPRIKIYDSDYNLIHTTTSPNICDVDTWVANTWTDYVPSFSLGPNDLYGIQLFSYRTSSGNRRDRIRIASGENNYVIDPYVPVSYSPYTRSWRWYDDENSLTPNVALGGEQVTPTGMYNKNKIRLRETVVETGGGSQTGRKKLQFSSDAVNFTDVGEIGSGEVWEYCDGGGTDDSLVSGILLSTSNTFGPYVESGTSASSFTHSPYEAAEYDFCLQENNALVNTTYYFRMIDVVSGAIVYPDATYFWPNITIGNHALNLEVDPNIALGDINMESAPGPLTAGFSNMYVRDYTGSGAGWSVTATATDLTDGLGNNVAIDNLSINLQNISAVYAETTGGINLGGGQLSNTTPINVATASVGSGAGNFLINGQFSLNVPVATVPGNYSSTLTLTIS